MPNGIFLLYLQPTVSSFHYYSALKGVRWNFAYYVLPSISLMGAMMITRVQAGSVSLATDASRYCSDI